MDTPNVSSSIKNSEESTPPPHAGRSNKRPDPRSGSKFTSKKPRFNNDKGTTYQRITLPSTLVVQPVKKYFQIHTGSKHFVELARTVYNVIAATDTKFAKISSDLFSYVSLIGFNYRLVQCGIQLGYNFQTFNIAHLREMAEALLLPDCICKAIECVGETTLPNGMVLVPYVPTDEEMATHADYIHPRELDLGEFAANSTNQLFYDGALVSKAVVGYMGSTPRSVKSNLTFRRISFDNIEGRPEFSIAREPTGRGILARATYQIEDSLAQLGAVYGFRTLPKSRWLGPDKSYFAYTHISSVEFEPALFTVLKVATDSLQRK